MSNRKLEGIRIREVEGRGGIPRQSAQRVKQPKGRKSGEKTRNKGVSRERERERKTPPPPSSFTHLPYLSISHALKILSPLRLRFRSRRKRYQTPAASFELAPPGLSFTQDTISLDHQRMRSAIWWIERLVAGERLERYSLESRTGR